MKACLHPTTRCPAVVPTPPAVSAHRPRWASRTARCRATELSALELLARTIVEEPSAPNSHISATLTSFEASFDEANVWPHDSPLAEGYHPLLKERELLERLRVVLQQASTHQQKVGQWLGGLGGAPAWAQGGIRNSTGIQGQGHTNSFCFFAPAG